MTETEDGVKIRTDVQHLAEGNVVMVKDKGKQWSFVTQQQEATWTTTTNDKTGALINHEV